MRGEANIAKATTAWLYAFAFAIPKYDRASAIVQIIPPSGTLATLSAHVMLSVKHAYQQCCTFRHCHK